MDTRGVSSGTHGLTIEVDYTQQFLFPPSIEDWVPSDHPARFIRQFVFESGLPALAFPSRTSEEGRPNYSPRLLLCAWLYGFVQGIRSSRKLELACMSDMGMIWLTGNTQPDHNTLWRFYKEYKSRFPLLFRQVVGVAYTMGLVELVEHALDGTKIAAVASNETGYHRKTLERELAKLDAAIATAMQEIDAAEETERGSLRLPPELADADERRRRMSEAIEQMNDEERNHLHPVEPEARMMKMRGGTRAFGYNAQAVVDRTNGIVVAQAVTTQENDYDLIIPMLDEVKAALGAVAEETVADAGYASGKEFARLQQTGYEATVALQKQMSKEGVGRFEASQFHHDMERDVMICPRGEALPFAQIKQRNGYQVRAYQCQVADACPERAACSTNKHGRLVQLNPFEEAFDKQRRKAFSDDGRARLRRRKAIVEPLFARVKEQMGFRRFTVRGLSNVQSQWAIMMTAVNLKKMMNLWKRGLLPLPNPT